MCYLFFFFFFLISSCGRTPEKEDLAAASKASDETPIHNHDKKKRGSTSKYSANKNCRRAVSLKLCMFIIVVFIVKESYYGLPMRILFSISYLCWYAIKALH